VTTGDRRKPQPKTANEAFLDALIRHQIYLLRYSGSVRNRVQAILNATEAQIATTVRDRLRNAPGGLGSAREVARMDTLLGILRNTRTRAWAQVNAVWAEEMVALANSEAAAMANITNTVSPARVNLIVPPARQLRAIALSRPFEGRVLRDWARSVASEDIRRIDTAVRAGMVAGETGPQIARRIVGTAALNGSDGVTEITRRQAEAITRTAVQHVSSETHAEFFQENASLFTEEQFVATLDSRTTPVCMANDGKRFPIGQGPRPPLHFNCRSLRVAVLDPDAMGDRPAKPFTERQLVREFSDRRGLGDISSRDALPRGTKGAYDTFARQRMRELTGTVPATETYQTWLKGQSATFQNDVLGDTRAQLFRNGDLTLDRFVNRQGDQIPLPELARREAAAFRAAGLNPENYR